MLVTLCSAMRPVSGISRLDWECMKTPLRLEGDRWPLCLVRISMLHLLLLCLKAAIWCELSTALRAALTLLTEMLRLVVCLWLMTICSRGWALPKLVLKLIRFGPVVVCLRTSLC